MKININEPWGDSIDTVKYSKPLDKWYSDYKELDYVFFKLPAYYSFDLAEMTEQVQHILEKNTTKSIHRNSSGKKYDRYKGLGFLSRHNAASPLEDHFIRRDAEQGEVFPEDLYMNKTLPDLIENDFVEPTEIYTDYFKKIFSKFKSNITKASLLELKNKGYLSSHVDFPYYKGIRLHATLLGGENAWYEIAGTRFQIPADGHWYFIDTGKFHSIWNHGPVDRLTINVNLSGLTDDPKKLAENFML